jgi:uncharacterized protein YciI
MTQWIYVLRALRQGMLTEGPTDEETLVLERHVRYLEQMAAAGNVIIAGRTQTTGPETFGIVVFRAESETAAQQLMAADPVVGEKVMTASLCPYKIAVAGTLEVE